MVAGWTTRGAGDIAGEPQGMETSGAKRKRVSVRDTSPSTWSALAVLSLAMAAGGITARLEAGPRFDWLLLMTAIGLTAAVAMRLLADNSAEREAANRYSGDPLKDILDSSGPMILSVGLDGRITYVNPTAERLLGYHAAELINKSRTVELLAPGEGVRLVTELQKLCGLDGNAEPTLAGRLAAYGEVVRSMPPSLSPGFETHLRRRNGELFPVRLQVSALRNQDGEPTGLVCVAQDQSTTIRKDQWKREARERYRDVFENSSEMIATLDLTGRFLYVNPAWKRCFAQNQPAESEAEFFEQAFSQDCRAEAASLLRRVMNGETIDRAPIRNEATDGHAQDLEISLHQRRRAGKPMAVQCLVRDVTQQKQREHRLALQLLVTQIVGENVSSEMAAMRVLEALCVSQGWDVAVKWEINAEEKRLEFSTAWGVPGKEAEALIQESVSTTLSPGGSLPGRAWSEGRLVWLSDLSKAGGDPRARSAMRHKMISGWATPVQVGNNVLAVLEFYCHLRLREDRETTAAMETVAASLGQMLARTRERERAEELSRQQKILLHSVADGICGVDKNGLVRFANPAATRLLGAPVASLIGKPVHELVHGSAPEGKKCPSDCALLRAAHGRVPSTGEDTIFRANGVGFPAEYFLNPILDMGRYSGSVLSFRDISQRYALDRLKDEFVSTVSHELRTPLTSIRGALGLLSSGILGEISDKATNLLRIALSNSDRLVRLINDILDLERAQSGREPLVFRPVQMADLVRQSMDSMQLMAESAGVLLIHDKTQVEITADADRLQQVLTNLLSNAIKFSPPNSAVSIMLRPGSSGITLSVIDQGRGIPADKLEAIFGRFQQVDASDSRQKGGSGLGLAICRAIVVQHNGRIWAERNPIRGSTFRVFLPYHPAASAKVKKAANDSPGQGVVLLASDNGASRPLLGAQLAAHGYQIVETSNAEQTLVAAHDGVEAIVVDMGSHGLNGWELLPQLKRSSPEAHTPLIVLSLDTQQSSAEMGRNGNMRATNSKEMIAELVRAIGAAGEAIRVLVVENHEKTAKMVGDVFSGDNASVKTARSRDQAISECASFRPHLVAFNVELAEDEALGLVAWLKERESLTHIVLVAYSGREIASAGGAAQFGMEPATFLRRARVQPEQLEQIVLTILRGSRHIETEMEDVSGVQSA
ncbi:MAG TPA: PAS domain S-box protein [Terracidiphilus sp.]|nr:PAS domain S-box protein [Terracidiphilus sp.]